MKKLLLAVVVLAAFGLAARAQFTVNLHKAEADVALGGGDRVVALANPAHYVASQGGVLLTDTKPQAEAKDTSSAILAGKFDGKSDVRLSAPVPRKPGDVFLLLKNPISFTGTPVLDYTVPSGHTFVGVGALVKIIL